jgi:alpha-L-glutamate ligase-like protein
MIFGWADLLDQNGVLGMNERNAEFIQRFNARRLYPLVDDKLRTKRLAIEAGIAVPELYGVLKSHHDVRDLRQIGETHRDFVIKPSHGSGGDGILVISGRSARKQGVFRLINGSYISDDDIRYHVSNIISGQYSLGGARDAALIEYRVQSDPVFQSVAFQGVPDIRVLVFKGYPAMAMVRLPTSRSHGKANLHQGAVGAGIDMASGQCTSGALGNEVVHEHPDTGEPFQGLQIPQWEMLLTLAARCYELTGLGYLGVDIVLDRRHGPLILELNARPGLNIQIANQAGLKKRLIRITELDDSHTPEERARLVRELF